MNIKELIRSEILELSHDDTYRAKLSPCAAKAMVEELLHSGRLTEAERRLCLLTLEGKFYDAPSTLLTASAHDGVTWLCKQAANAEGCTNWETAFEINRKRLILRGLVWRSISAYEYVSIFASSTVPKSTV